MTSRALGCYQKKKLRLLLRHAYNNVPFYRQHFRSAGIHPEEVRELGDLANIPVVRKADLREAPLQDVLAKDVEVSRCLVVPTSGSTGEPFRVYLTRRERIKRSMLEFRGLKRIGLKPRDRLVILGPEAKPSALTSRRLGLFSVHHISPLARVEDQVEELEKLKPDVFWVYPSHLRSLLFYLDGALSEVIRPRIVITSAEVLDQKCRAQVERDLGVQLFQFYASAETGRIAVECACHQGLHINADAVILEIARGDRVCPYDEQGTVLVTSLQSLAMPIIRYELGDISTILSRKCRCGSAFPLMKSPFGRRESLLVLPSGRKLSFFQLSFSLRVHLWIRQFLVIQEKDHRLTLLIKPARKPGGEEMDKVQSSVCEYLGEPVQLEISLVENLPSWQPKFSSFYSKLEL